MAMTSEAVFETDAFRKVYGSIIALEGLTVRVPNAAIGLLGANGSGKSTLIKGLLDCSNQPRATPEYSACP